MSEKKRILLIDNEEGLCRMMEAVLLDSGYKVKAYTRSFQAVEEFVPGDWDLVISDIKMPGMDGLEVLQRIKAMQARQWAGVDFSGFPRRLRMDMPWSGFVITVAA